VVLRNHQLELKDSHNHGRNRIRSRLSLNYTPLTRGASRP
jgi:hypothetical protein